MMIGNTGGDQRPVPRQFQYAVGFLHSLRCCRQQLTVLSSATRQQHISKTVVSYHVAPVTQKPNILLGNDEGCRRPT